MNKLCTFGGSIILSYVGWYLGAFWGIGWAFSIGAIGNLAGVYLGWKVARRFA